LSDIVPPLPEGWFLFPFQGHEDIKKIYAKKLWNCQGK
jgi:hypothetical protein